MVMSWEKILKVEVPITPRQRKLQFTLEDDHVEATKNWHLWWFQVYGFNVKIDQVEDAIYKLNVKYEYVTMYVENASNNRGVWFLHHMHTLRRRLVLCQVRETQLKTWHQNCSISLQNLVCVNNASNNSKCMYGNTCWKKLATTSMMTRGKTKKC